MFWKKKPDGGAAPAAESSALNPYAEDEARDFLLEAEKILLKPEPLLQAAGISASRLPLRELFKVDVTEAANALATLLQGPNGGVRKTAAFAFAQLGSDDEQILILLKTQKAIETAKGNIEAIDAAIEALGLVPRRMGSSELDRRRAVENLYEGRAWKAGLEKS